MVGQEPGSGEQTEDGGTDDETRVQGFLQITGRTIAE
jgi:hypothetical protein